MARRRGGFAFPSPLHSLTRWLAGQTPLPLLLQESSNGEELSLGHYRFQYSHLPVKLSTGRDVPNTQTESFFPTFDRELGPTALRTVEHTGGSLP